MRRTTNAGLRRTLRLAAPAAQHHHSRWRRGRLLVRPAGALAAAAELGSELARATACWARRKRQTLVPEIDKDELEPARDG